jgi:hypothetical protein
MKLRLEVSVATMERHQAPVPRTVAQEIIAHARAAGEAQSDNIYQYYVYQDYGDIDGHRAFFCIISITWAFIRPVYSA